MSQGPVDDLGLVRDDGHRNAGVKLSQRQGDLERRESAADNDHAT